MTLKVSIKYVVPWLLFTSGQTQNIAQFIASPTANDLRSIQSTEDRITEAIAVVDTNWHVLQALLKFYDSLLRTSQFTIAEEVQHAFKDFSIQVGNIQQSSQSITSRAQHVLSYARERKALVRAYFAIHNFHG